MNTKPKRADIHVKDAWILTMDSTFTDFPTGSILISGNKLSYIGEALTSNQVIAKETIDAKGKLAMPPFFNGHAHAPMSLFRGFKNDVSLSSWLADYIWPAEASYIDADSVYLGTLLSGIEMIQAGVNIFADMYFFEDQVAQAAEELGMRAIVGEGILDFPTPNMKTPEEGLKLSEKQVQTYSSNPLIQVSFQAHSPYSCSAPILREISQKAKSLGIPVGIHLSETRKEVEDSIRNHGLTPPAYLAQLDFLHSNVVCYHCTHLTPEDRKILKDHNVGVVSLPNSNSVLGSGIAPIASMMSAGISVSIGTDGAASNNNQSVLQDIQLLVKQQKVVSLDPTILSAKTALQMATINGSSVYQLDENLGSLEVGKFADLILIELEQPHLQPIYDPYAQIIYAMQSNDVSDMLVNGKIILQDRTIVQVEEEKVIEQINRFSTQLKT